MKTRTCWIVGILALTGLLGASFAAAQDSGARGRDAGAAGGSARVRPPGERDAWRLGATVETLDTGVQIRSVERGGAAEGAGLEAGDIIVTVAGYQVGRVGGRQYGLEEELQRQADTNGRVLLLVQDKRNNRLMNIEVRLQRGSSRPDESSKVLGRAVLPSGERPPRSAELHVRLVRRQVLGEKTVAEVTQPVSAGWPADFELTFDPRRIERDKDYELEVEVREGGRRVYVEQGRYRVRLDRPADRIEVRLRRT